MSRPRKDLVKDIAEVLNRASRENASDTSDFILAEYMVSSLETFESGIRKREEWYGRMGIRHNASK
jgi:hypothetical protein